MVEREHHRLYYERQTTHTRTDHQKLRAVEAAVGEGKAIADVCKQQVISVATYHRWQKQYRGMDEPTLKQYKELQKQNTELKKMVAEQALDIRILKEVAEGKW